MNTNTRISIECYNRLLNHAICLAMHAESMENENILLQRRVEELTRLTCSQRHTLDMMEQRLAEELRNLFVGGEP